MISIRKTMKLSKRKAGAKEIRIRGNFKVKPVFTPTWRKRWREGVAKTLRNFLKKCSLIKMAGEITPYKNSRIKSLNCSVLHYKPMFNAILVMWIKLTGYEFGNLTENSIV